MKRGLYVHIPFCSAKCHYCDFVITTHHAGTQRGRFFAALNAEIAHAKKIHGPFIFDTLYLGGGTPSLLSSEEMTRLIQMLKSEFQFKNDYEFTCEVNPQDVSEEKLRMYSHLGINRLSLGAQAFQGHLLKDMGREHTVYDIQKSMQLIKKLGFRNVSLDLILRLPGQTPEEVCESLKQAIDLGAAQLVLYDLDIHEKTVYGFRRKKGKLLLPKEEEHLEMFRRAKKILQNAGFRHYELATFARPGFESRHNLIYWHNEEYLGLGPGAFSYLNGLRYQFAQNVDRYLKKCEQKDFSNDVEEIISEYNREIETLLTGLRLEEGIELSKFVLIRDAIQTQMVDLIENGFLERDEDKIQLTDHGKLLFETLIEQLLEPIQNARIC